MAKIEVRNLKSYDGPGERICRPSPLGNPWSHLKYAKAIYVPSRKEALENYRIWLPEQLEKSTPQRQEFVRLLRHILLIGDLNLLCHCKPADCHGDFIKQLLEQALATRK